MEFTHGCWWSGAYLAYLEFLAADRLFAACPTGISVISNTECRGPDRVHVVDGETGPVTSLSPIPDLWCLPWGRPTDQSCFGPTWTQNVPLPGPSAPYYGFLWYGGQATRCSSSPETRTNFPPTPVVSATCMPCPQSPGPRPADTDACSRMNFTLVPGDPRTLPHAQGFPLPSSSQLLPVSLPYTDLPGAQDFARLRTMGGLPSQPHP